MTLRGASTAIFRLTALSAPLCSGDQAHNLILLRQFPDHPVQFNDTIAQSDVLQPIKRREGCGRRVVVGAERAVPGNGTAADKPQSAPKNCHPNEMLSRLIASVCLPRIAAIAVFLTLLMTDRGERP
jgi:hypothetical protein